MVGFRTAVLYLSKQEKSFRGNNESSLSLNKGNYREALVRISTVNPKFQRHLHRRLEDSQRGILGGGVFTGVSADIQNEVIECVDSVLQDEIDSEITDCNFLSIQVDETKGIFMTSLTTLLVYWRNAFLILRSLLF